MFIYQAIQYAISGITAGSIYAIVGICWSTVFLISGVLNFTTGEFVMLGGMLTWVFTQWGISLIPAMLFAVAGTVFLATCVERLVIRPVRYPSEITFIMTTTAASAVIKGIVLIACGSDTRCIQPLCGSNSIRIGEAMLVPQVIVVVGALVLIAAGLHLFLNHTLFGKAFRASAINQVGARLVGIKINRVRLFSFGLAGGLGAIAGIAITPIEFTGYSVGLMIGLKGLVVALLGGWTITGTVVGGLALGLLEGMCAGFISSGWKDALALMLMTSFLILRTFDLVSMRRFLYRHE
jgi:branched-chain amino acid transport system permease protein